MKWINADQQVTVNIYDDEHEECLDKIMTVEEMLDAYTDEGCPTIYANPEPRTGHWIKTPKAVMGEGYMWYCDKCEHQVYQDSSRDYPSEKYCPNCGARMGSEEAHDDTN